VEKRLRLWREPKERGSSRNTVRGTKCLVGEQRITHPLAQGGGGVKIGAGRGWKTRGFLIHLWPEKERARWEVEVPARGGVARGAK